MKSLPDQGVRFEGGSLHTDLSHSALTPQSHKLLIETLKRHERATRARHSARRCYAGKSSTEGARLWGRASAAIRERRVLSEKNRSIRFSSSVNCSPGSDQAKEEEPDGIRTVEDDNEDDGDDDGIGDDDGTGEALSEYVSARTGLRQIMLDTP